MYKEIDVEELARWRKHDQAFVLLDVRDDDEVETASIAGSLHMPMATVPQRMNELDRETTIAVLCHHGGRSARVAQFLTGQGFADVYNVDGGIDAYARAIDPLMPRY